MFLNRFLYILSQPILHFLKFLKSYCNFTVFIRQFLNGEISHLFINISVKVLKNKKPHEGLCQAETCCLNKYC